MKDAYQVRVHVIEARQLKGSDDHPSVNPITKIRLRAGDGRDAVDKTQYTRKEHATNSVLWDETKIFQEEFSREQFKSAKLELDVEDDHGFFSNTVIGGAQFDLMAVYEYRSHEIYGRWVALMREGSGSTIQGYLRVSITVLKEGDQPKIHSATDLDEDGADNDLVIGMPDIDTETYKLIIKMYRVELAPYGFTNKPALQVRVRFGSTEMRTAIARPSYEAGLNDELLLAVFLPTLTDRIKIDVINTRDDGAVLWSGALVVRIDGAFGPELQVNDLLACWKEADLFPSWMPAATSSVVLGTEGYVDMLIHIHIGVLGLLARDGIIHGYAVDALEEEGKLLILGKTPGDSAAELAAVPAAAAIPPAPAPSFRNGWQQRMVYRRIVASVEPLPAGGVRAALILSMDVKLPLPRVMLERALRGTCAQFFARWANCARAIGGGGGAHAARIAADPVFYREWLGAKLRAHEQRMRRAGGGAPRRPARPAMPPPPNYAPEHKALGGGVDMI